MRSTLSMGYPDSSRSLGLVCQQAMNWPPVARRRLGPKQRIPGYSTTVLLSRAVFPLTLPESFGNSVSLVAGLTGRVTGPEIPTAGKVQPVLSAA